MEFYKNINEYKQLKPGDIVVNSHYHWYRTIIVATTSKKTMFLDFKLSHFEINDKAYFEELTMEDLDKLKPHLRKVLMIDYNISFNKNIISKMPKYCCYPCGAVSFSSYPKQKIRNTIGKCNNCGKEKIDLYETEYFKKDIYK